MNLSETSFPEPVSLADRLHQGIKEEGPITFRDWMQAALYDPQQGYYCRQSERWGRAGDYRTSPEYSPLFAATFARYFVTLFEALDRPQRWTIMEAGAGGGQFAEVLLDNLQRRFPQVFAATNYVVDEVSPASIAAAKVRLARFGDRVEFGCLQELRPDEAGVIFSNELLDAFPVHRVTLSDGELRELYVALDHTGEFAWVTGPLSTPQLAEYFDVVEVTLTREGQVADVNLAIAGWLTEAATRLSRGYLITVDYGAEASDLYASSGRRQGTLRAFRRHEFREPLENPGDNDLTSSVDWTYFRRCGEKLGFETIEFQRQDQFLLRAGLLEELELMVQQTDDEAEKARLRASAREMILPTGLANSFQVLVQKKSTHNL
jgi:SAM-dependent MidA family methyltransferase